MESIKISLPQRAYALCFTHRSGSNYLARELRRTRCLGAPDEFFDYETEMFRHLKKYQPQNLRHYVSQLAAATSTFNGVFGAKIHSSGWLWLQRSSLRNWLREMPVILTFRRDIIAQTVSYQIAFRSGAWHSELPQRESPAYDFEELHEALRSLEDNNRFWTAWLMQRRTPVLTLAYEDFAADTAPFIERIAEFLGVSLDPAMADPNLKRLSKQATILNAEWDARFRRDLAERGLTATRPALKTTYPGAT